MRNGSCIKSIRYHDPHAILSTVALIEMLVAIAANERGPHCTIQAEMTCRKHVPLTEVQIKVNRNSGTF